MSSAANSAQPTAGASDNLSNVLGSIGQSSTNSPSAVNSASSAPSASGSGSGSGSNSAPASASASASASATRTSVVVSNTITNAPSLTSGQTDSASSLSGAPSLTSGNSLPKLTDLPTLSGYYSYPPPTVPPTSNAPYMQKTNLPENFVFIVVGACIAFVAFVIIGWRTLTAWSINRRFRRGEGIVTSRKNAYTPLTDFKQKPAAQSTHDMKDLGSLPRNFSSVPSLFFSPTAEVAKQSMRPPSVMDSSHAHLPAGHYRDASRT